MPAPFTTLDIPTLFKPFQQPNTLTSPPPSQLSVLVEDPPSRAILASALPESLDGVGGSLRKVCIVSQAALVDAIPTQMAFVEEGQVEGLGRGVVGGGRAEGAKCERCWVYDVKVRGGGGVQLVLCMRSSCLELSPSQALIQNCPSLSLPLRWVPSLTTPRCAHAAMGW